MLKKCDGRTDGQTDRLMYWVALCATNKIKLKVPEKLAKAAQLLYRPVLVFQNIYASSVNRSDSNQWSVTWVISACSPSILLLNLVSLLLSLRCCLRLARRSRSASCRSISLYSFLSCSILSRGCSRPASQDAHIHILLRPLQPFHLFRKEYISPFPSFTKKYVFSALLLSLVAQQLYRPSAAQLLRYQFAIAVLLLWRKIPQDGPAGRNSWV